MQDKTAAQHAADKMMREMETRAREARELERQQHAQQLTDISVKHQAEVKSVMIQSGATGSAVGLVLGLVLATLLRGRHARKAAAGLLLLAAGPMIGCGSCSDGYKTNPLGGGLLTNSQSYSACSRGCVKKDKRCDCSKQCPCWGEHKTK